MNSPRYAPAGLLVESKGHRVMIDGGPGAEPKGRFDTWLVTDEQGELIRQIRKLARARNLNTGAATYFSANLLIQPQPVVHTSHVTYGYAIDVVGKKIVWAPEFIEFPGWADGADLMFAEAAGWNRPIHFRGGVGGHACAIAVSEEAHKRGIKRLVFAHIGRPTIKAIDAGKRPSFGVFGEDGDTYIINKTIRSLRKNRSAFQPHAPLPKQQ